MTLTLDRTIMDSKNVETVGIKVLFSSVLETFPFFPGPQKRWFFYILDCTEHRAYTKLNSIAGVSES